MVFLEIFCVSPVPRQWIVTDIKIDGIYDVKCFGLEGVGGILFCGFIDGFQSITGKYNFVHSGVVTGSQEFHTIYCCKQMFQFSPVRILI